MSLAQTLQSWKQLASSASDLESLQRQLAQLEAAYCEAERAFENGLEQLAEEEREAILEIMAIYSQDQAGGEESLPQTRLQNRGHVSFAWLLNKVGNEGASGIRWGKLLEAWKMQYPDNPTAVLYTTLARNRKFFSRCGRGKEDVVRLTGEGQTRFLNA